MILNQSKMKRIAIIEIYSHHVFVETLSSVLLTSGCKVDIYLSNIIYKQGGPLFQKKLENLTFHVSDKDESDFMFLRRIKPKIESENELVILNSVQGYRILFFFLVKFNIPTIAGAGRISEFFGSNYELKGFKTFSRLLHHNFTRFLLPRIVKRLKGIIVHTEQAKSLAIENGYKSQIHKMPFSLYLNLNNNHNNENINFLVTGSMNDTSRDYESLLGVFEKVWNDGKLNNNLTILSSPRGSYGRKIFKLMESLKKRGYPINYFSDWIPEKEYINCSKKADFLIAPILYEYYNSGELTSVTVESIRMGIPAIYPQWYRPEPTLEKSSLYYSSFEDLYQIINMLIDNKDKTILYKELAKKSYEELNIASESKKISSFLEEII